MFGTLQAEAKLTVVAWMWTLYGSYQVLAAVIDRIDQGAVLRLLGAPESTPATEPQLTINLVWVTLLIGIGLLCRKHAARVGALFFSWFFVVMMVVVMLAGVTAATRPGTSVTWIPPAGDTTFGEGVAGLLLVILLSIWQLTVLRDPEVRALFGSQPRS